MTVFSIASGSSGNCYFVKSKNVNLIIDAGITFKRYNETQMRVGFANEAIDGILITHEHGDHIHGAGVLNRKLKAPLFMTKGTFNRSKNRLGKLSNVYEFRSGETLDFKHIKVRSLKTLHDASEPVNYIIDDGQLTLGIMTDFGRITRRIEDEISNCDILFFESNYDTELLKNNPNYPEPLKRRISGGRGHISNKQSAEVIRDFSTDKLKAVFLSHLSENNNYAELAYETHLDTYTPQFELLIAPRYKESKVISL